MQHRLLTACRNHDMENIKYVFQRRPDLFQRTGNHSPLEASIDSRYMEGALYSIEHGTPIEYCSVHNACTKDMLPLVQYLLEHDRTGYYSTNMELEVANNHPEMGLIAGQIVPKSLGVSVSRKHWIVSYPIPCRIRTTFLLQSAFSVDMVNYLYSKGSVIDKFHTIIKDVLHYGHSLDIIKAHLDHGADPNIVDHHGLPLKNGGWTSCVDMTVAGLAVICRSLECLKLLHQYDADLTFTDKYGYNILHLAAKTNSGACARYILECGIDAISDIYGKMPYDYALEYGADSEIAKVFLEEYGPVVKEPEEICLVL